MRSIRPLLLGAALAAAPHPAAQVVFAPPTSSPVAPEPGGLLTGDLDGDGVLDLVLTRSPVGGGTASVALGVGDGTFVEGQALVGQGIVAASLDDLDGDGALDLVMVAPGFDGRPVLRFGNGDGTFGAEILLRAAKPLLTVQTGDVDGDGDVDLALGGQTFTAVGAVGDVSVLLNDGSGSFPTELDVAPIDGEQLAVGDMDADGRDDVVIASLDGSVTSIVVALSQTGGFTLLPTCADCALTAGSPKALELADVDGDGDLDVLVQLSPLFAGPVTVFSNDGTGALSRSAHADPPLGLVDTFTTADVDGDGLPDVIGKDVSGSPSAPREIRVSRNLGGTFGAPLQVTMGTSPFDLETGDFDGDGRVDVGVVDGEADAIVVALNATYASDAPFVDLGAQLGGTAGFPIQLVDGTLAANSPLVIDVSTALPGADAWLFAGAAEIDAPFKGGVLVPAPDLTLGPLPVDAAGTLSLGATWPSGVPSGLEVTWQFWIVDAGSPAGLAATSAVRATAP